MALCHDTAGRDPGVNGSPLVVVQARREAQGCARKGREISFRSEMNTLLRGGAGSILQPSPQRTMMQGGNKRCKGMTLRCMMNLFHHLRLDNKPLTGQCPRGNDRSRRRRNR
jgi:hypothetical protein